MTQLEALNVLKTGANVFLTGKPGSGKTYIINEYIRYLKRHKINVAITASTGIAATHIGGVTIHSWSGIGIKKIISAYDLDRISSNERLVNRVKQAKVLVLEEISMLDGQTLTSVEQVCRAIKNPALAFGGLQVIFVGDFFQLPPVNRMGDGPSQFAFESKAWQAASPLVCYLSEQHRQADAAFLDILEAVRQNNITAAHKACLDKRCHAVSNNTSTITKLFPHNEDVDRINQQALHKIPGKIHKFSMVTHGRKLFVDQLIRGCLSPENLQLKIGAVVMFTKNSPSHRFVNGTLGEVIGFEKLSGRPQVRTKYGKEILVEPMEWAVDDNGRILARIIQIPLRLAWAMTVHKSQGTSLDAAYIDLRSAFAYGQGYVALSRVRTLAGLFLAGYNDQALLVHPDALALDQELTQQSAALATEFSKLPAAELQTMHRSFIRAMCGHESGGIETKRQKTGIIRKQATHP